MLLCSRVNCHLEVGVLALIPTASLPAQFPANVPGEAIGDGLNPWAASTWETRMAFQAPGFGMTQLGDCWEISLSLCINSAFQIHR